MSDLWAGSGLLPQRLWHRGAPAATEIVTHSHLCPRARVLPLVATRTSSASRIPSSSRPTRGPHTPCSRSQARPARHGVRTDSCHRRARGLRPWSLLEGDSPSPRFHGCRPRCSRNESDAGPACSCAPAPGRGGRRARRRARHLPVFIKLADSDAGEPNRQGAHEGTVSF